MSHTVCVVNEFISENHKKQINAVAEKHGFSVRYYQTKEDAAGQIADCEVLFGHWRSLLKEAPSLKWYCCSYAGVDPYQPPFRFPEGVMLTNSSGAYGVTIAEHILMVTLMLQRKMPDYTKVIQSHVVPHFLAAVVKRRFFSVAQRQFHHFLHAILSDDAGDAHIKAGLAILAAELCAGGHDRASLPSLQRLANPGISG